MGAIWRGHKQYFLTYKSDALCPGTWNEEIQEYDRHLHTGGNGNSLKTMKSYISKIRKTMAEYNPRDFRVYDSDTDDEVAPCVYREE